MEGVEDCCKCYSMRQQIEDLKQKHILDFRTIKQKIISTDELIKLYQKKCQEFEKQTKYITTLTANLDAAQRNTDVIKLQLEKALELNEPLKSKCNELEKDKQNDKMEKETLQDHIRGSENLVTQLKTVIKEKEQTLESLKLENVLKTQDIDAQKRSLKKNESVVGRLKEQVTGEKKIKKDLEKKITKLEGENNKLETEKETFKKTIADLKKEINVLKNAAKTRVNTPSPRGRRTRRSKRLTKEEQSEEVSTSDDEDQRRVFNILEEMKWTSNFLLSPLPPSPPTTTNNDSVESDVTITKDYGIDDVTIGTGDVNDITSCTIDDLIGGQTKNNDGTSSSNTTIKKNTVTDDNLVGHTIPDDSSTIVQVGSDVIEADGSTNIEDVPMIDYDGVKVIEPSTIDKQSFEPGTHGETVDGMDQEINELDCYENSNLENRNKDILHDKIFDREVTKEDDNDEIDVENAISTSNRKCLNSEPLVSEMSEDLPMRTDFPADLTLKQESHEKVASIEKGTVNIEIDVTQATKDHTVLEENTRSGIVGDKSEEVIDNKSSGITKERCPNSNISTGLRLVSKRKRRRNMLNFSSCHYHTRSKTTPSTNNRDDFTSSLMSAKKSRQSLMRNSEECKNEWKDEVVILQKTTVLNKGVDSSHDVNNVETRSHQNTDAICEKQVVSKQTMSADDDSSFSLRTTEDHKVEKNDNKVEVKIGQEVLLCVQSIVDTIVKRAEDRNMSTRCTNIPGGSVEPGKTDLGTEDTSSISTTNIDFGKEGCLNGSDDRPPNNGVSITKVMSTEDKVAAQTWSTNMDEPCIDESVVLDNLCEGHFDSTIEPKECPLSDRRSIVDYGTPPSCEDSVLKESMNLSDTYLSPIPDTPEKTPMSPMTHLEEFTIPSLSPLPPSPEQKTLGVLIKDRESCNEVKAITLNDVDQGEVDSFKTNKTKVESSLLIGEKHQSNFPTRKNIQSILYKLNREEITSEEVVKKLSQIGNLHSTTRFTSAVVKCLRQMCNEIDEGMLIEKFHEQYYSVKDVLQSYIKRWRPIITSFEHKLTMVVYHISKHFSNVIPCLVNLLWTALSHLLISEDQPSGLLAICRFFVVVSRMSGAGNKIRLLCYELVKHYSDHPYIDKLLMTVALVWPEVLFLDADKDIKSQPFLLTLQTIIMSGNIEHVKGANDVLHNLCGWTPVSTGDKALESITIQLVGVLRSPGFATLVTSEEHGCCLSDNVFEVIRSIEVVCGLLGWKWTNNVLIRVQLWPIFDEWKRECLNKDKTTEGKSNVEMEPLLTSVLRLLGNLAQMALQDKTGDIRELVHLFSAVLSSQHEQVTIPIQIAAAYSALTVITYDQQELSKVLVDWMKRTREPSKNQPHTQIPTQLIQRIEPLQTKAKNNEQCT